MEDTEHRPNKYNLRSKGDVEEIFNISPKKNKTSNFKTKTKIKVEQTTPKRVVILEKNEDGALVRSNEQESKIKNEEKDINKYNFNIDLIGSNTKVATFSLLKELVSSANNQLKRKQKTNKDALDSELSDDESDPDFEPIADLHPDVEYTDQEDKYIRNLPKKERDAMIDKENALIFATKSEIPLRFRILNSALPLSCMSAAISKLDHFYTLDPSENEYGKLLPWVNTLDKIPFNKYIPVPVTNKEHPNKIMQFIAETKTILDTAVYGHDTAKTQILSILAKQISNPNSCGNAIAIQGPMGNGKTTLVKEGICKAMKRPFSLIALGGMTDASYLAGHEYTYEGARAGRIVEILCETGCLNPVIYFDELDKVSETAKGEEIMNLLCHLTDPSQNMEFTDKFFSGIHFDLSKALFIFSYNDESKINPILLDRMYKIKTDGFNAKSKLSIASDYLLPSILKEFNFNVGDITFDNDAFTQIINCYCNEEKGVRNLKRNIETVVSKLNIMRYLSPEKVELIVKAVEKNIEDKIQLDTTTNYNTENDTPSNDKPALSVLNETVIDNEDSSSWVTASDTNSLHEESEELELVVEEKDKVDTKEEQVVNKEPEIIPEKPTNIKDIVDFTIKNFKIPYNVRSDDLNYFLKPNEVNPSIQHLYI